MNYINMNIMYDCLFNISNLIYPIYHNYQNIDSRRKYLEVKSIVSKKSFVSLIKDKLLCIVSYFNLLSVNKLSFIRTPCCAFFVYFSSFFVYTFYINNNKFFSR